jgi:broad specificity phosphatase PhoE
MRIQNTAGWFYFDVVVSVAFDSNFEHPVLFYVGTPSLEFYQDFHSKSLHSQTSMQKERRIYAIRHGQSEFNVLYESLPSDKERYHPKMKTIDCDITQLGISQSRIAGEELPKLLGPRPLDCMVISPLRRALQTADNVLQAMPQTNKPIVEISQLCTEVMLDACDIGSTPTELAREFPRWDFSHLDQFWWHGGLDPEETWKCMQQNQIQEKEVQVERRMELLREYLRSLDHGIIVVVCHSDVIWWLTSQIKEDGDRYGTHAKNGEITDITEFVLSSSDDGK